MDMTTIPIELDLDGRSAYINNRFVSDAELSVHDTSSPLYELLQKQMETVLNNKGGKLEVFSKNSPQIRESSDELINDDKLKLPPKPLFNYDMTHFDDYEEEEEDTTSEDTSDSEYMPENCEDTQESLKENESSGINNQASLLNTYGQPMGDSSELNVLATTKPNKPYDSSNYGPQMSLVTTSTFNSGQSSFVIKKPIKTTQKPQVNKNKPSSSYQHTSSLNTYGQMKPSDQYAQKEQKISEQNSNKQQQSQQKPHYITASPLQSSYTNTPKPSSTKPNKSKPYYTTMNQKLQASTLHTSGMLNSQNMTNMAPTISYVGSQPTLITSSPVNLSNYLFGNTNTNTNTNTASLSPFSSTSTSSSSSSSSSATSQSKRHLTFRTVAQSTQYVSSPLADLMFKFSIGMAKPANSNSVNNFGDE